MPTQAELDAQNKTSIARQRASLEENRERRDIKAFFAEKEKAIEGSGSWGGDIRGALYDISTNTYTPNKDNQQGIKESTEQRGVDSYQAPVDPVQSPGSGGVGITDFLFVFKDGSTVEIDFTTVTNNYNAETSWSIKIPVSGALDTNPANWDYEVGTAFFNPDASDTEDQTYYRLPIYRSGKLLCSGGVFRENIYCNIAHGPIAELVKIG